MSILFRVVLEEGQSQANEVRTRSELQQNGVGGAGPGGVALSGLMCGFVYSGTGVFRDTYRAGLIWKVYPGLTPPKYSTVAGHKWTNEWGADHHNQKPSSVIKCHTLILRSLPFCINYSLNPSWHAIDHIIYALPREFLPLLCNLCFSSIEGAPLSEPLFCSLQHGQHILNRIQIWRTGRLGHFPNT